VETLTDQQAYDQFLTVNGRCIDCDQEYGNAHSYFCNRPGIVSEMPLAPRTEGTPAHRTAFPDQYEPVFRIWNHTLQVGGANTLGQALDHIMNQRHGLGLNPVINIYTERVGEATAFIITLSGENRSVRFEVR